MRALLVLALLGCGRVGFDPRGDASGGDGEIRADGPPADAIALVIDGSEIAGELTDFPVLVRFLDDRLAGAARTDLWFVDDTGAVLAHEIESLQASGELIAWIKLPILRPGVDTTFWLRRGGTHPVLDVSEVWTEYAGVFHFSRTTPGVDATGNDDAVPSGAPDIGSGRIADALSLQGTPDTHLRTAASGLDLAPGAQNTLSYWMFYEGAPGRGAATFAGTGCGSAICDYDLWHAPDGCFGFNTAQDEVLGIATTAAFRDRWVHVVGVFVNGVPSAQNTAMYIDGVRQTLVACRPGTAVSRAVEGPLIWGSNRGYELMGRVDEGRFARGAKSAAWIATEFANQSDPEAFVRVAN